MAVDIGPKIGIDGEAQFRKELNNITNQIKTFGSEMKMVTSEFEDNEDSMASLNAKNKVLTKSIDAQTRKLEELKKGLAAATTEFGQADSRTQKWQRAVYDATTDLNKMKKQLKDNEDALENFGKQAKETGDDVSGFGDILKANLISDVASNIASGLKQMAEESKEVRKIMGSLEVSSEKAGYNADQTKDSYKQLYGVLADNQTAATTTANLQAIGLEQERLEQITDGVIGAWATYGDSIPIDGLAEAINETVKVGQVTGTFADVLNWAGTSEDEFNAKLEKAGTQAERANIIMEELASQGLMDAGKAWQENNKSLVESNQAAAEFELTTAKLGETVEPVFTAIQNAINGVLGFLGELAAGIDFEGLASGISGFAEDFLGFLGDIKDGSLTLPEIIHELIPEMVSKGGEMCSEFIREVLENLPEMLETGAELIKSMVGGIMSVRNSVMETGGEVMKDLLGAFIDNLPQILETGVSLIMELIAGIIRAIPDVILAIPKVTKAIADELKEFDWKQIGIDILKGLANGIVDSVGSVVDAAKEAAGKIAKAFKDFFDINSPSVFMQEDIAGNMMKGIPKGFKKYTGLAVDSALDVAKDIAGAFSQDSIPTYANGTAAAYDRLAAQMGNLQVVLEDGTLVGKLSPRIDMAIGGYTKTKGRYYT